MNILVTGGAGFIGSHTVERLLQSGAGNVSILDSFNDYYNPAIKRANVRGFADRVTCYEGDLTDKAFIQQVFEKGRFDAVGALHRHQYQRHLQSLGSLSSDRVQAFCLCQQFLGLRGQ
jgi:nucleoside-diphosphate-sugar epimerase